MWNPITALINAYMEGRNIQLAEMKKQTKQHQRVADSLDALVRYITKNPDWSTEE